MHHHPLASKSQQNEMESIEATKKLATTLHVGNLLRCLRLRRWRSWLLGQFYNEDLLLLRVCCFCWRSLRRNFVVTRLDKLDVAFVLVALWAAETMGALETGFVSTLSADAASRVTLTVVPWEWPLMMTPTLAIQAILAASVLLAGAVLDLLDHRTALRARAAETYAQW